jgi:HEAT repeat protein
MSFEKLLENALGSQEKFFSEILPELQPDADPKKLSALLEVFESGNVVGSRFVSDLFIKHLGAPGLEFLTANLNYSKPKSFVEIASILGELRYSKALPKLEEAIQNGTSEVVLPAVKAVACFEKGKIFDDVLGGFYLTHKDETVLYGSIKYLLERHESLVPFFLSKYRSLTPDRKMWVLKYLSETRHVETVRLFSEELDANPLERGLFCIHGLGKVATPDAVEVLAKHVNSSEWFLRKRIAEALGHTSALEAISPLIKMLKDDSLQVRAAAVEGLSKVGDLNPAALIDRLKVAERQEKINLIRAMGQLKKEEFIKPLIEILKDRDALFFSIDALGDLGFVDAEIPLKTLLKDEIWFNRLNALEALAKLPINSSIVEYAKSVSQDENDMVRKTASRILANKA